MPLKAREVREILTKGGIASTNPISVCLIALAEEQHQLLKRHFEIAQQLDAIANNMARFMHIAGSLKDNYEKAFKRYDEDGNEIKLPVKVERPDGGN